MTKLRFTINDALGAFELWAVAAFLLVAFLGYPGQHQAPLMGLIIVVSVIGLSLRRMIPHFHGNIAVMLPSYVGGWTDTQRPGSYLGNEGANPCPNCRGGRVTCGNCNGMGTRPGFDNQRETCVTCSGQGSVSCSLCGGSGRF